MAAESSKDVVVLEKPIDSPRRLRMVCIGAGFAGVFLAHRHKFGNKEDYIDLAIYEKNPGIGGTWYERHLAVLIPESLIGSQV